MNNYFTLCKLLSPNDKIDQYNCCLNTCYQNFTEPIRPNGSLLKHIKNDLCNSSCKKLFLESEDYKSDCSFESGCWNVTWDNDCIKKNEKTIYDCCVNKCNKKKSDYTFDCDRFCKEVKL